MWTFDYKKGKFAKQAEEDTETIQISKEKDGKLITVELNFPNPSRDFRKRGNWIEVVNNDYTCAGKETYLKFCENPDLIPIEWRELNLVLFVGTIYCQDHEKDTDPKDLHYFCLGMRWQPWAGRHVIGGKELNWWIKRYWIDNTCLVGNHFIMIE